MSSSKLITFPRRLPSGREYRLREFMLAYVVALAATFLVTVISVVAGLVAYFAAGIFLSRFVSARVLWWNQEASVSNVCRAKLRFIARWMYELPLLVFQVFVARDL